MVLSLLTSLVLAVTFTPSLAACFMRHRAAGPQDACAEAGRIVLRRVIRRLRVGGAPGPAASAGWRLVPAGWSWSPASCFYTQLETDFLPKLEEGAFVLDYYSRPGTSLSETDRMLLHVEEILRTTRGGELFAAHGRAPGAGHRRAEHRRLPGQAAARPQAFHRGSDRRNCGRRFTARAGTANGSSPAS